MLAASGGGAAPRRPRRRRSRCARRRSRSRRRRRVGGDELDGRARSPPASRRRRAGPGRRRPTPAAAPRAARPASPRDSVATSSPASAHASAQTTQRPARVGRRSPRRRRAGSGCSASTRGGVEQVVEPVAADHARARRTARRRWSRRPRSARRCATTRPARPRDVRPALTASTGFARATRRATRPNLRGLPNDSRYSATTCGRRVLLPVLQEVVAATGRPCRPATRTRDSPIPRRDAPSIAAAPNAPLWETKPIVPGGHVGARERRGQRHVGIGVDDAHAVRADEPHPARRGRPRAAPPSRAAPSAPASANPAVITTSARDARRGALARHARHGCRGHGDDREVDRPGDRRATRARREPTKSAFGLTG